MSYIITGRVVATCHAFPRPVSWAIVPDPSSAVPYFCEIAGVIGHVSGVLLMDDGSSETKSTATSPGGRPLDGMSGHDAGFTFVSATRPNTVGSYATQSQ